MYKEEFIRRMIGKPWVNRAASWSEVDCWGLAILYSRHVLGIELPEVEGYKEGVPTNECWTKEVAKEHWEDVEIAEGDLVFTCFKNGRATHVGVCIDSQRALHCAGGEHGGSVAVHSLRALERLYGKMQFARFRGYKCQS